MVSLRWADVLSTLLPGSLALLVVAPHIPPLAVLLDNINAVTISSGVAFLGAGALAGGLLEAITRLTWERGSGADRIVGAIRSGVHRGDAAYAAMT